ncbi:MAG: UbiX family flavin prenyltransferase [Verrucomicrobiae bacterium]|nr:UbiX family flavin prenyltransferase [Verrucomicrobiae bacterium]
MRFVVGITGASGALYAQRLLDQLGASEHLVHLVVTRVAREVIATELPGGLRIPPNVVEHEISDLNAPFASGSSPCDGMVVIPCTMGTLARIAHGVSDNLLLRAADVVLKERKKLILVPRETPLNLVHVRNMELLILAGATVLPANPSFYVNPRTAIEVVDTVVARVLDHLGVRHNLAVRWHDEAE